MDWRSLAPKLWKCLRKALKSPINISNHPSQPFHLIFCDIIYSTPASSISEGRRAIKSCLQSFSFHEAPNDSKSMARTHKTSKFKLRVGSVCITDKMKFYVWLLLRVYSPDTRFPENPAIHSPASCCTSDFIFFTTFVSSNKFWNWFQR